MTSFQHHEELRSMLDRLDKVLPGHAQEATKQLGDWKEEAWDWRNTVIEARTVGLERSVICPEGEEEKWRYSGGIPKEHQWSPHRRWYITERTRVMTEVPKRVDGGGPLERLPPGTSLWHGPDTARRLQVLARHDAKGLLDALVQGEVALPMDDEWATRGILTLFATQAPTELCHRDCARLLLPHAPYLTRFVQEYARAIGWMYGLTQGEFDEHCRLKIAWHKPGAGRAMELLPASPCRYENGPVVLVSAGKPVVAHDLAPTLQEDGGEPKGYPTRMMVPEGVMVCLDGASRMRHSHGHPKGADTAATAAGGNNWFVLTFFMDCTRQSVAVGYERETRAVIMATPIRKDRVVASVPPESYHQASRLGLDMMGSLVKSMRLRLRVAESHLLASRYLPASERKGSGDANSSSGSSCILEKSSR
jgi:hypothetical protein